MTLPLSYTPAGPTNQLIARADGSPPRTLAVTHSEWEKPEALQQVLTHMLANLPRVLRSHFLEQIALADEDLAAQLFLGLEESHLSAGWVADPEERGSGWLAGF